MNVADRTLRIGQVLLTDQHERPLRHPPGVDIPLGRSQFPIGPGQVYRARPTRVGIGPGHAALDGEVDFEGAGTTAELGEGARNSARQTIPEDARDRSGRQIEHRDVCRRQLRRRLDVDTGLDLAAQLAEQRHHRIGDRLRSTFGHRPAVPVAGRDDAHSDCGGHRVVQRPEGVGRNASEQCPPLISAKQAGEGGRGKYGRCTEPGQHQWMMRDPQQRAA